MQRILPLAAFLLGAAVLVLFLRPDPPARGPDAGPRDAPSAAAGGSPDTAPPIVEGSLCREAAYLCGGFAERQQGLVARWPDGTSELRVRVTRPEHEGDRTRADELVRAAARGIRVWQGQPFPLRIETDQRDGTPDIEVRWVPALEGSELGRVSTTWSDGPNGERFVVREFVLVTRVPGSPERGLSALDVERAAAHEMGHALGLPHSPDSTHLMFPDSRSAGLSVDDYRAVESLYRMPAGARLTPPPDGG